MTYTNKVMAAKATQQAALLTTALALLLGCTQAMAQASTPTNALAAGEVEFARGVGFAQSAGQTPRTLGKGLALREGDRLTTSDTALAVIKLQDGTRMTVRPNTEMVLQQYRFKENAPDNNMLMQLLRGGFRAVTGLISKNSPNAARIQTSTATIGIRGTDFDARVCAKDCSADAKQTKERPRPNAVRASAKVLTTSGDLYAVDPAGQRRRLVEGGSLYPGDAVETAVGTQAVLAFRDASKIRLGFGTLFRLDNFIFDEKNPGEGRYAASLVSGSVRALPGLIAKANYRNVAYNAFIATVGFDEANTGEFSIACKNACADPAGLTVYGWQGSVAVTPQGQTSAQMLQSGQGLFISGTSVQLNNAAPKTALVSPAGTPTPLSLFTSNELSEDEEGLYVFVRDGHIEINTRDNVLHLGRGEAGFAGSDGSVQRPITIPRFLDFDPVPMPNSPNLAISSILGNTGAGSTNICR